MPVPKVVDEVRDEVVAVHPEWRRAGNLEDVDLELNGEAGEGVEGWFWRLDVVFLLRTEVYSFQVVDRDIFDVRHFGVVVGWRRNSGEALVTVGREVMNL